MNILTWNCRGAGGKTFPNLIRDLKRDYDLNFVILLETHISGDRGRTVRNRIGFDGMFVEDARGQSGGIWCLWNSDIWEVEILWHKFQFVHMRIQGRNSSPWMLTAIYGSPQRSLRKQLWKDLEFLSESMNLPWCVIRDFNAYLHDFERKGGSISQNNSACRDFQNCVSNCGLLDLGYSGWPFTWKRGSLFEGLDRGLSNMEWQMCFPDARIKHLPMLKSDHSPLLLQFSHPAPPNRRRRPFHFLAGWLSHPDFKNLVQRSWKFEDSWNNCMNDFQNSLRIWNSNVFGDINKKKSRILRRLQGITNNISNGYNRFLEDLQGRLWAEYEETLAQEELLWFQKSRCN
ncbi:uncharacterized protein [Arachis hypogaea]|uniref:uncharacterized protein n=1 Tax=Arachis hypogaea TaxID=3818 RepID=UPI0007AF73AD|nr:uncharacterized protein LOC112763953 [Arachis hypogaea]